MIIFQFDCYKQVNLMSDKKIQGIKTIGNVYQLVKPLFQVRSYFYAQVCCIAKNYQVSNAALYLYENEDPSQSLKMLSQKLNVENKAEYNIIFPYKHLKFDFGDKNISLFFIKDYMVPFRYYEKKQISIRQTLELLYGAITCLHNLHIRDIIHGNISLSTCYLIRQKEKESCKFGLNILDTLFFTEEDCLQGIQEKLFQSQGQSLGQKSSFKDDLQSLVYVMVHLISKGKLINLKRFQLQWVTQSEFLKWKSTEFFKEMIKILPPELQIIVQIYLIAKSLQRNQKPNYIKLLKKILAETHDLNRQSSKLQQTTLNRKMSKQKMLNDTIDQSQIKVTCKTTKKARFKENNIVVSFQKQQEVR